MFEDKVDRYGTIPEKLVLIYLPVSEKVGFTDDGRTSMCRQ